MKKCNSLNKFIPSVWTKKITQIMQQDGLKGRFGRSSTWTLIGFAGNTFFRMISSLILTRIFIPDVFGLMAIIAAILVGIELLSDVGIRASIIQNPKGEEPSFLRTAWTIQAIRGLIIWLIIYLISGNVAQLYNEPELVQMLPFAGLVIIIRAFSSTSTHLCLRKLHIGKFTRLELFVSFIHIVFVIILSLIWENIWAMLIGTLLSTSIFSLGTYLYLQGGVVGFQLDKTACSEVFHFGKWIILATMLTFLVGQGDRLILGTMMTKRELGLYNLAVLFSSLTLQLITGMTKKSIMPALAEVANKNQSELYRIFNSIQQFFMLALLPIVIISSLFGNYIIMMFYTTPYYSAGWMFQVLSAGMVAQVVCLSISPIFIAKGDSFSHMLSYASRAGFLILSIIIGYKTFDITGMIFGVAIAPLAWLPIIFFLAKKHVKVNYKNIIIKMVSSYLIIGMGWWLIGLNIFI